MKVKVTFVVEKEMEMSEDFYDTKETKDDINYCLKVGKEKDFYYYLQKIIGEIGDKIDEPKDVEVAYICDEYDNFIYGE
jgi:hypothetical protein